MRNSKKTLSEQARKVGLFIDAHGERYKILTRSVDYYAASGQETLFRGKAGEVEVWLKGYEAGRERNEQLSDSLHDAAVVPAVRAD